ncbi:Uncharacterized protein BP5553_06164 [Venustampulla echinocandica]|uniref:Uncharacterized protein n=1 Tax=Venustampulla echinocandica TaxID=2656787 RepID=A0A370TMR3_9HELO|nr:Uncharacterized protein BP5553_06164 [Venustampulla echinocandica]RDL36812.1 Uncharacterized protein BP5553_06164 [Venustampulla echinocandica]
MANNNGSNSPTEGPPRNRRGSITSQTFTSLFGRSNSVAGGPTAPFPNPISTGTVAAQDQRRRMSITTLGLSGTSPTQASPFPFGARRGSVSTAGSESIDESAIDDEEGPARSAPTTPFPRRMSFGAQAMRRAQPNGSPGTNGRAPSSLPTIPSAPRRSPSGPGSGAGGSIPPPKPQNQAQASMQSKTRTPSDYSVSARAGEGGGFNWSEQLRSRAESSVSQSHRPNFSTSPPAAAKQISSHDRQKSVGDMATPPSAIPAPVRTPPKPARKQPDAFQERILKGDFYMD